MRLDVETWVCANTAMACSQMDAEKKNLQLRLAAAIGRECGNEPKGPLKGHHTGWFIRVTVIPCFIPWLLHQQAEAHEL